MGGGVAKLLALRIYRNIHDLNRFVVILRS